MRPITCDDNGIFIATLTVDDSVNAPVSDNATVTVNNVTPAITSLTPGTTEPVDINEQSLVNLDVSFTDPASADTHDVTWDWGDGTTADTQLGGTSPALQGHTYAEPGVYRITVTVSDDDGGSDTAVYEYIVIYDPEGGFVTGVIYFRQKPSQYRGRERFT